MKTIDFGYKDIISGYVDTFADLPSTEPIGTYYIVNTTTGSLLTFNRKLSGIYRYEASGWVRLSPNNTVSYDSNKLGGVDASLVLSDIASNTSASHNLVTATDSQELAFTINNQDITASLKVDSITSTKLWPSLRSDIEFNTDHRNQSNIHFTQGQISIPASQISDFNTQVSIHTDVSSNTAHRLNNGSEHSFINQDVTSSAQPLFNGLTINKPGGAGFASFDTANDTAGVAANYFSISKDRNIRIGTNTYLGTANNLWQTSGSNFYVGYGSLSHSFISTTASALYIGASANSGATPNIRFISNLTQFQAGVISIFYDTTECENSNEASVILKGGMWCDKTISAAAVIDRTPYPKDKSTAYDALFSMQRLPPGQYKEDNQEQQLDHSGLHSFIKNGDGRNLSATVSILAEVVKDIHNRLTTLEHKQ